MAFTTFELDLALQSCLAWALGFVLLFSFFRKSAELFCNSMPPEKAFLPRNLPHPNPDGSAVPFELTLTERIATESSLTLSGVLARCRKCD